jgi:hypothetical protein
MRLEEHLVQEQRLARLFTRSGINKESEIFEQVLLSAVFTRKLRPCNRLRAVMLRPL